MGVGMRIGLASWMLIFTGVLALAQSPPAAPVVGTPAVASAGTVELSMIVRRQDATPVADLKTADLELFDEGKPRTVELARPADRQNVLLVLPYDGGHTRKAAIEQTVKWIEGQDRLPWNLSIFDCNGWQSIYTADKAIALQMLALAAKSDISSTALYEADWQKSVHVAIAQMRDLPGRRGVLLLEDRLFDPGEDGDFHLRRPALVTSLQRGGAQLYVKGGGDWRGILDHVPVRIKNVKDTAEKMQQDAAAFYLLRFELPAAEQNGALHRIQLRLNKTEPAEVSALPVYYAPSRQLEERLAGAEPLLKDALAKQEQDGGVQPAAASAKGPASEPGLQVFPSTAYFPTGSGAASEQVLMAGIEWMAATEPPKEINVLAKFSEENSGRLLAVYRVKVPMRDGRAVWQTERITGAGTFTLQVAAADVAGKVVGAGEIRFANEADNGSPVRMSSLVLGRGCEFQPPVEAEAVGSKKSTEEDATVSGPEAASPAAAISAAKRKADPLLQLHCRLQAEPTGLFSSGDVVWAMARVVPLGAMAGRPPGDWQAQFLLRPVVMDKKISKKVVDLAATAAAPLVADAGPGYLAAAAIPLSEIAELAKMDGKTGQFVVVMRLTGPGIQKFVEQPVQITVYPAGS